MLPFLIPIIAIGGGIGLTGFREWIKFKERQEKLGTSTHELEERVESLQETLEASQTERRRLVERVQNLETIVTSQSWDALAEGAEQKALSEEASRREGGRLAAPEASEEAERLARRVRG